MTEPIENEYFNWLCAKVLKRNNPNYWTLFQILHRTEFVWVVSADRHRIEDGIELRLDFLRETGTDNDPFWESQPCSMLEFLIALAKRASFQTSSPVKDWFLTFLINLKLERYTRVIGNEVSEIEDILYTLIWRQYEPNGFGGLFPLDHTMKDQRKIEIWYQMSEYILERELI